MGHIDTTAILNRRDQFPRGLTQPDGGYRFSLDSLLLSCFATVGRRHTGIDLGCGCGVIGIGMALRQPGISITGVELNPDSLTAAQTNITNLHLHDKITVTPGDVATWRSESVVNFVVANPPYRQLGTGRISQGQERETARFEARATFSAFARCAAIALKTRGKFIFVHLAERLPDLMHDVAEAGLVPKRMQLVHGRANETAKIVLMETMKAGGPGVTIEPPLILHEGTGPATRLTQEALNFCPYLACNTGAKSGESAKQDPIETPPEKTDR
ncbi:methyltransferase [Pseudodesulfovibrio sp. JC047]|uniref:tRNA1(Val) (adenine(37)-N6)-methyltransferase n=1 Tax=Pseudodesulfovibrio sp. JC047 TaxID=2683199 RepID=UPI0013D17E31|nr:methyltransferase [Pseudodesulfovibrio sp. JC047]NDV18178.1 methyltransferase [Pseudodesulfovibrio sp. JC047]